MSPPEIKFREEALAHLYADKSYDTQLKIVSSQAWLLLVILFIAISSLLLWGFLGSIPVWVDGKGIILTKESNIYSVVAKGADGEIIEILASPQQKIAKDQPIAKIRHSAIEKEAAETEELLNYLKAHHAKQEKEYKKRYEERTKEHQEQQQLLKKILVIQDNYLTFLTDMLKRRKELFDSKLLSADQYQQTFQEFSQTTNQIHKTNMDLVQNEIALKDFIDTWHQRLNEERIKIEDTKKTADTLREEVKIFSVASSPVTGKISSIQKSVGNAVAPGDTIATVVSGTEDLDCIVYVPSELGKQVKKGMSVQITPTYIKREEYGSMIGKVVSVSPFPVSANRIQTTLQNESLVKALSEDKSQIEVRVALEKDPNTKSGFAWTSSQGPDKTITQGTIASARVIIERKQPISLIIPAFKHILGL
jgi:HlyD family secretion protein